jgi:hypothetical protein
VSVSGLHDRGEPAERSGLLRLGQDLALSITPLRSAASPPRSPATTGRRHGRGGRQAKPFFGPEEAGLKPGSAIDVPIIKWGRQND